MVGPRALGLDAQGEQLLLGDPGHLVVALRGEDEPVVAEKGGRVAPGLSRFMQYPDDIRRLDHLHGPRGHAQPGVVEVEHLVDVAVGQFDVGHVGLPALVGQRRFEADERALRALLGLDGDEPPGL